MVYLMIIQVLFVGVFLLSFMLFTVYLFQQQQVTTGDFVLISAYIIGLTMPILQVSQSLIRLRGDYIQYLVGLEQISQGKLHYKNIDISQQFSTQI